MEHNEDTYRLTEAYFAPEASFEEMAAEAAEHENEIDRYNEWYETKWAELD